MDRRVRGLLCWLHGGGHENRSRRVKDIWPVRGRRHRAGMQRHKQMAALLARRERDGLTLRELSEKTGIPFGTLSWWSWRLRQEPDRRPRNPPFVEVKDSPAVQGDIVVRVADVEIAASAARTSMGYAIWSTPCGHAEPAVEHPHLRRSRGCRLSQGARRSAGRDPRRVR